MKAAMSRRCHQTFVVQSPQSGLPRREHGACASLLGCDEAPEDAEETAEGQDSGNAQHHEHGDDDLAPVRFGTAIVGRLIVSAIAAPQCSCWRDSASMPSPSAVTLKKMRNPFSQLLWAASLVRLMESLILVSHRQPRGHAFRYIGVRKSAAARRTLERTICPKVPSRTLVRKIIGKTRQALPHLRGLAPQLRACEKPSARAVWIWRAGPISTAASGSDRDGCPDDHREIRGAIRAERGDRRGVRSDCRSPPRGRAHEP
jgi:hypothetical protein